MTALTQGPAVVDEAPTPSAEAEEAKRGGAPTRVYIVLEQIELDGDQPLAYQVVTTVEARNGQNALRKAFKDLRTQRTDFDEATLAVIPEGQWKPTPVKAERKESITVSVGR